MKTKPLFLLLLWFAFSGTITKAQDYVPLALDGARWFVGYDVMANPSPMDALWEYHANGDTVVDGHTYLKVYRRDLELNPSYMPPFFPATEYELAGLLREDIQERKVYAIVLSEQISSYSTCPLGEENLLFDFSLSVGDTASFCVVPGPEIFGAIEITDIFPATIWGIETMAFETFVGAYYEGIGSDYGLFEEMFAPLKSQGSRYVVSTFLAHYCRENDCGYIVSSPVLNETAPLSIRPNPATTHTWLQLPENTPLAQVQIELYSPTGRLLYKAQPSSGFHKIELEGLPKGLYLVRVWDGKKWLVEKLVVG